MPTLSYDVYVAPSIPTAIPDLPPDLDRRWWSPITSTLISGESDAVLVDRRDRVPGLTDRSPPTKSRGRSHVRASSKVAKRSGS
jgi:hypothetical protein